MKKFRVTVNGNSYDVEVEELGNVSSPATPVVETKVEAPKKINNISTGSKKVLAPMPGKIVDVKVKEGQKVNKGNVVAILEAMKMENEVVANEDGTIIGIHVVKGQSVDSGDTIVSFN